MNRHFSRSVWQSVAVVLLALPVCAQQAAPARVAEGQELASPGEADVAEPPLLLEVALVDRA